MFTQSSDIIDIIPVSSIAGACAGISSAIIGQPLDTIKVRIQSQAQANVSLRHLYRGLAPQVGIQCLGNTVLFSTYERLSGGRGFDAIAAVAAGCIEACFYTPLEFRKTRQQMSRPAPWYQMYRGFSMVMLKESIGNFGYFGSYYLTRDYLGAFGGGCVAGLTYWGLIYPIDTLKTRYQATTSSVIEAKHLGEFLKKSLSFNVITSLYRGVSIALIRSLPVNGVTFWVYDKVTRDLHKQPCI